MIKYNQANAFQLPCHRNYYSIAISLPSSGSSSCCAPTAMYALPVRLLPTSAFYRRKGVFLFLSPTKGARQFFWFCWLLI